MFHIDQIIQQQNIELKKRFEKSRIVVTHRQKYPNFQLLFSYVSTHAIDSIMEELKRSNGLELDNENCGCQLRTSCGLPCACELVEYFNSGQYINLESIDIFWRKLDLKPTTNLQENNISCDEEIEMLKKHVNKQSKFGKTSILRKIKSLYNAATTSVAEPAVQKNTRGRPNLKSKSVKSNRVDASFVVPPSQDPFTRSFSDRFDLNKEPGEHSSYANSQTSYSQRMPEFHNFQPNTPQEKARHSSYVNSQRSYSQRMPQEQARHSSYANSQTFSYANSQTFYPYRETPEFNTSNQTGYSHPLLPEIPNIFHPYINQVHNVLGDGNCGFRAVAVSLGRSEDDWPIIRSELLEELRTYWTEYDHIFERDINGIFNSLNFEGSGFAPTTSWMIMPDTSLLIASRYGVIVHFLSNGNNSTCFPIRSSPSDSQHHLAIVIALVFGNHYVSVELQGQYPMPQIMVLWRYYKQPCAAEWETMYKTRLDMYTQQNSRENFNSENFMYV